MTLWTKSELLQALSGELLEHNLPNDLEIDEVVIDSRKTPKSGLFIAIKGEKNDGHDFLEQATANGCKAAIVDRLTTHDSQPTTLLVKDTFVALYKLAEFSRNRSRAKIIAITGSVGKTGTKEMLKMVFETQGKVFATAGNFNNHIGMPLSLCNFSRDCAYGIFEMGMNHLGEIDPLSRLARPDLALITNVGPVHIEFFKNEEEIVLAKSEIFCGLAENGIALINADNAHFEFLKKRAAYYEIKPSNLFTFSEKNPSNYQILQSKILAADLSEVKIKLKNGVEFSYEISSSSAVTIFNSIIVIACLDLLGANLKQAVAALKNLQIPAGRGKVSEVKFGEKNVTIIDDSYNASVLSMRAGLEHAADLKKILHKRRVIAALGDMLELGEKSVELHDEVANYLAQFHIDFALLVGENMTKAAKKLPKNSYKTFPDSSSASLEIEDLLQDGDILYLKGSRGTKMEKLIENLITEKSAH